MKHRPRPYFLDLTRIRLPIGAWVSILHRASGAVLALAAPGLLYLLALSLESPDGFATARAFLSRGIGALVMIGLAWALLHHYLAGVRHLGFDAGLGESLPVARRSALVVLVIGAVFVAGLAWVAWR